MVWETLCESSAAFVLTSSMIGVSGRAQSEGDVVHIVAYMLFDLFGVLASVSGRDTPFPLGRGDELARGPSMPDPRAGGPKTAKSHGPYSPDTHGDTLKLKTRDFR